MTRATYRVQLHRGFTFADAAEVVPLLSELGVTHLFTSPIFQAVPGSTHGYDVADPTRLSDDLGGPAGFATLLGALREAGLSLVVDIVPNHMAADPANPWWWDVLEDGPSSVHSTAFDIDWLGGPEGSGATVLVPVLGDHYGRVLEAGEVTVARERGGFVVRYGDHRLPLSPRTFDEILGPAARAGGSAPLAELAAQFGALPDGRLTDAAAVRERHERKGELRSALIDLLAADPAVAELVDAEVRRIDDDPDRLDGLLRRQHYRLARWRIAGEQLDYRRFFNIETLVGVRTEDPEVFDASHALLLELVRDGSVDGLRVDHVDGLRDPAGYLERLAEQTGGIPTVVEKILAADEPLPSWPVEGTTGYDFLTLVDQVFVDATNESALTRAYADATGDETDFAAVARTAKRHVMDHELVAEVDRLVGLLSQVCEQHRRHRDHTRRELREALVELVCSFDVYRTYVRPGHECSATDLAVLDRAAAATRSVRPDLDDELVGFLVDLAAGREDGPIEAEVTARLQQLTAPVMAKGIEDTAFYRYHRLISLNEVGGDPGTFGRSVDDFHRAMQRTADEWPDAMLTLSTHDTKRSADVRARLDVLSEESEAWAAAVESWIDANDRHWAGAQPDRSAEYLLYQSLVGAWPIGPDRIGAFMEKAMREAKVHTSWTDPDAGYEEGVQGFARNVLADRHSVESIERFLRDTDLVARGRRSSLVQTALLLTCPGHPDLYQGAERWDLSLTDPDNRREVDVEASRRVLAAVRGAEVPTAMGSLGDDDDGVAKAWLLHRLLHLRTDRPELFDAGYEPIEVRGGSPVIAFRRADLVVVAPCRTAPVAEDASVRLPVGAWRDVLTGAVVTGDLSIADLVAEVPVAVLLAERS